MIIHNSFLSKQKVNLNAARLKEQFAMIITELEQCVDDYGRDICQDSSADSGN